MAGIRNSTESGLANAPPEEYLDKTGITTVMKDMMTLLLENRPEDPIRFFADYLKNVPNTCIMKSYKIITLNRTQEKSFMDNLVSAYINLEHKRPEGLRGYEFIRLIQMVCLDFPSEVTQSILDVYGKKESDIVTFEEFINGIHSTLLYEDFFAEAEVLFRRIANEGIVNTGFFFKSLDKLHNETELRMPSSKELQSAISRLYGEGKQDITFKDFVLAIFDCTN